MKTYYYTILVSIIFVNTKLVLLFLFFLLLKIFTYFASLLEGMQFA